MERVGPVARLDGIADRIEGGIAEIDTAVECLLVEARKLEQEIRGASGR